MNTMIGKTAPDFRANAVFPDDTIDKLNLLDYRGKYVLLFFYPLDFTFVCPTEILAFNKKLDEFKKRDCEVIGVSVDSEYTHLAWRNLAPERGGIGRIKYPLVSDLAKDISNAYRVLNDDSVALRGLFLIDREGIIRHMVVNDLPLGRNEDEAIRVLDALKFHESTGNVCPISWEPGQDAMEPTAEGVADYLGKHYQ